MIKNDIFPKPFIKWAGGKTKLIPHIIPLIDQDKFNYYEPFLGGGALFFHLIKTKRIKRAYLNDINVDLINAYAVIKSSVDDLLLEFKDLKYKNNKEKYLEIRSLNTSSLDDVQKAARFIYLNRTCFNGLYRVNKQNQFNVPFGKYSKEFSINEEHLRSISQSLKNATLSSIDFRKFLKKVRGSSVVYFDPPYLPIKKDSFTEYTENGFSLKDHEDLAHLFGSLGISNCCILSNSGTEKSQELYSSHDIIKLLGNRNIGGSPESRVKVTEILVKNRVK
jgi:DNA adenine methylase